MDLETNLEQAFNNNSIDYQKNAKSFVLDCPMCDKSKGVYLWKTSGYGKCHKCDSRFNPYDILVALLGVTYTQARKILNTGVLVRSNDKLEALTLQKVNEPLQEEAKIFKLPYNFFDINAIASESGQKYLLSRGVSLETATKYRLKYCPASQRVVFPVFNSEKKCLGWQDRDVTGDAEYPYDSPGGFNRASCLFGYTEFEADWAVVVEGPFDFLKVSFLGGALCTFGKQISDRQLTMIKSLPVKDIYLALDPDAFDLFDKYAQIFEPRQNVWIMQPPDHRKDFGDCTKKEIENAFENSIKYTKVGTVPTNILEVL